MEKRVVTVLRSGGDFQPRHVQALQRQLAKYAPAARLVCLSDVDVPGVECIPLKYDWPGWWAKLELFRPDIVGDFLTTDLDNVFLGPLDDILCVSEYTTQLGESNALAYLTEGVRARVWKEWVRDPDGHMHRFHPKNAVVKQRFGDGGFIASLVTAGQHWEEILPGQVMNIARIRERPVNAHQSPWWPLRPMSIPKGTRILLCYRPWRPWCMPMFKDLY